MRLNRILFACLSILFATVANSQEIKVKLMEYLPNDVAARTHPRPDANGVNCALIRVVVPAVKGMKFDGWVVGDYEYQPGEYHDNFQFEMADVFSSDELSEIDYMIEKLKDDREYL